MAISCGFFNSLDHDRRYSSLQMAEIFDGIVMDGVYEQIGEHFLVRENIGMTISVDTGRAWFNHTWTKNDTLVPLTVEPSELIVPRIDTVVLDINHDVSVRANSVYIVKGAPSSSPTRPTLIKDNTNGHYQYPLADIYVAQGASEIKQTNITNRVGTSDCPFVTGPLKTMSIDSIVVQWEAKFMEWFSELEVTMEDNQVTALISQINRLKGVRLSELKAANWSSSAPYTQSVPVPGLYDGDSPYIQCIADAGSKSQKKAYQKQWGFVDNIEIRRDLLVATCKFDKPTVDLPIMIKGR